MDRERIDRWFERIILGLVLASLIFAPLGMGAVGGIQLAVVQGLTLLASVVWIGRLWFGRGKRILWPPICWAVLLFVLYAVLQYFRSDVEFTARQELIKVVIYGLLFFVVLNNIQQQQSVQVIALSMLALAAGIASYAVYQYASGSQHIWNMVKPLSYANRGGGTFVNPNHLVGFLGMILPVGFALLIFARLNAVAKIFIAYACLVLIVGIFVTLSRGGWLATAVTMSAFCLLLLMSKRSVLRAILVAVGILAIAVGLYVGSTKSQFRIAKTFDSSGNVEDVRFHFWKAAISMWKEQPILGVGPGHFDYRYPAYRGGDWKTQGRPGYAHNDYLNTLADWGGLGIGIISITIVLLGIGIWRSRRALARGDNDLGRKKSNREAILLGTSLGLLAVMLHSFVEFNMQIPAVAMVAVTWMALLTGFRRYESDKYLRESSFPLRLGLTLAIVTAAGFLAHEAMHKTREYVWLKRAEKISRSSPEHLIALKNAHRAEPGNFETTYLIGEVLRQKSFLGEGDYEAMAKEAMTWYRVGMDLNRYSAYNFMRYGMCLDWLGAHEKAFAFFEKAIQIEPNSYYFANYMGWHFMQSEEYALAKQWFERSLELNNDYMNRNPKPGIYLQIIERRLKESSAPADLIVPPKP